MAEISSRQELFLGDREKPLTRDLKSTLPFLLTLCVFVSCKGTAPSSALSHPILLPTANLIYNTPRQMVTVDKLVKDYGSLRAVDGVSFSVNKGDILGFLGPNGAGKSTTMKMIAGFLTPTSGSASVEGYDVKTQPIEVKKRIGYLPESSAAYPEMTVVEFLSYVAEARGILNQEEIHQRMADVIVKCHLDSVKYRSIENLSKGYRQRVGVAQAILHDPPVLILDEPTDGLDPNQKHEVRKLIQAMSKDKAIILSTHILEEVEAICNRVIIIDQGKVLVDETPQAFKSRMPGAKIDEVFREITNKNVLA